MNAPTQHDRPQRGGRVDFFGSVVVALSIAVALILDRLLGWGDGRWAVLDAAVVQVMLPLLAVWILVALVERVQGLRSTFLLVAHCAVAVAPAVALALLDRQGRLLSPGASEQLAASTVLTERNVDLAIVALAAVMAIAACAHAVRPWLHARQRNGELRVA